MRSQMKDNEHHRYLQNGKKNIVHMVGWGVE